MLLEFGEVRFLLCVSHRHWKHMWISNTFIHQKWMKSKVKHRKGLLEALVSNVVPQGKGNSFTKKTTVEQSSLTLRSSVSSGETVDATVVVADTGDETEDRESALTNACNIGTALMVVNSYRTLAIMWAITGVFPLFLCLMSSLRNDCALEMTRNLQEINLQVDNSQPESCEFLGSTLISWLAAVISQNNGDDNLPPLLSLEILPERCDFTDLILGASRVCTTTGKASMSSSHATFTSACDVWNSYRNIAVIKNTENIAARYGVRPGAVTLYSESRLSNFTPAGASQSTATNFTVIAAFDQTLPVRSA
jgi:hypothetical protein